MNIKKTSTTHTYDKRKLLYDPDTLLTNFSNDMKPFVEKVIAKYGKKDVRIVDVAFDRNGVIVEDAFGLHATETKDYGEFWDLYESMFDALPDEEVPRSHKFTRNLKK